MVLQNGSTNDVDIFQEKCSANMACSANFIISSAYLRYKILIAPLDNQGETVGIPYVSEFIGKCKLLIVVVIDLVYFDLITTLTRTLHFSKMNSNVTIWTLVVKRGMVPTKSKRNLKLLEEGMLRYDWNTPRNTWQLM